MEIIYPKSDRIRIVCPKCKHEFEIEIIKIDTIKLKEDELTPIGEKLLAKKTPDGKVEIFEILE